MSEKFHKLIVVGDRVLIRLKEEKGRTKGGLYLPPGVSEKEEIASGYVLKTGPGFPIPLPTEDEPWKSPDEKIKYVPLQAQEGDLAIFLRKHSHEIMYDGEKFFIVPQHSILLLERDEELFD